MFQGGKQSEAKNKLPAGVRPEEIDAILLTHEVATRFGLVPNFFRSAPDAPFVIHGSLGRRLVDGQKVVTIFGERIPVLAKVHTLNGFSGHADQNELLKWFGKLAPSKPKVILTHGEDEARNALAGLIQQRHKITPTVPKLGEVIEI